MESPTTPFRRSARRMPGAARLRAATDEASWSTQVPWRGSRAAWARGPVATPPARAAITSATASTRERWKEMTGFIRGVSTGTSTALKASSRPPRCKDPGSCALGREPGWLRSPGAVHQIDSRAPLGEDAGMTTDDAVAEVSPEETDSLRRACTRFLTWHGWRPPADYLGEIPPDTAPDVYGEGGVVEELEHEVASVLGKPSAAFLPTGTMAQQIALRVHADRRGR